MLADGPCYITGLLPVAMQRPSLPCTQHFVANDVPLMSFCGIATTVPSDFFTLTCVGVVPRSVPHSTLSSVRVTSDAARAATRGRLT